jgi:hypothetical protein
MKISRARLEAAARAYLLDMGFEYEGASVIDCAESTDRNVYNPRCAKAVAGARKILQASQRRPQDRVGGEAS